MIELGRPMGGEELLARGGSLAGATAADGVDGLWAQLGRTWKKRTSVELVDVVEELHDLLSRGVLSGGQLAELAQRSELIAPTLAGCAKERKARAQEARARRQLEEAAAAAAAASPEMKAAIRLQRHLRSWQAREQFAWLQLEQARKQREGARRVAKEKKLELEVLVRAQLADVRARWAETHASQDLDAVAEIVAQAARLKLCTVGMALLLAGEKARREEEAAAAEATEGARAAAVLQAHARCRGARARTTRLRSAPVLQAYARRRITRLRVSRIRAAMLLQAHARRRLACRTVRRAHTALVLQAHARCMLAHLRAQAVRRARVEARLLAEAEAEAVLSAAAQRELDIAAKAAARERRQQARGERRREKAKAAAQRELQRDEEEKEAMRLRLRRERVEAAARARAKREAAQQEQRELEARAQADRQKRERMAEARAKLGAEERAKRLELCRREAEAAERRRAAEAPEEGAREAGEEGLAAAWREAARRAGKIMTHQAADTQVGSASVQGLASGDAAVTVSQRGDREAHAAVGEARAGVAKEAPHKGVQLRVLFEHEARLEAEARAEAALGLARGMEAARHTIEAGLVAAAAAADESQAPEGAAAAEISEAPHKAAGCDRALARCTRDRQVGQLYEGANAEMAAEAAQHPEGDQTRSAQWVSSSGASANSTPKARLADARDRDGRINSAAWSSISAETRTHGAAHPAERRRASSTRSNFEQHCELEDMDLAVEARKRGDSTSARQAAARPVGGTGQASPGGRWAAALLQHGTRRFTEARAPSSAERE
jgi:colicin import membrane protein